MTNIRDIARESGYSVSTVSRVLNHRKYVSPAVRDHIEQVMQQLNYVPNAVARDLSSGHTKKIGVALAMVAHPYYTTLVKGITKAAFEEGYQVTLLPTDYDAKLERRYLEQLRQHAFDGLIFTSHSMPISEIAAAQAFGPVVICQDPGSVTIPAAFTDRQASYHEAFAWIKQAGYQRVGLMLPRDPNVSATASAMVQAYTGVIGAAPAAELTWIGSMAYADGLKAGALFAANGADFVFANGDDIALGVHDYYQQNNLPLPGLMGQENQVSSALLGISTIDHHFQAVGRAALALATGAKTGQIKIASDFIARPYHC
ncbi:LacI family DNA-binding transcriptional regulator [Lacticaseibacillus suibinensis]|uniref:LacI family DNA-binding transcriptional regulator n=1 Tax=Lacticaseibacillus suibinensis TaxID=2486011 RepID=UPI001943F19A|nr:LacI family DNA-binding transcriptional regulator [Lacticaseibacillus suibinensis]